MVRLLEDRSSRFNGETVRQFTWHSDAGVTVTVISYGAIIQSIKVPDKLGEVTDIVLGFDDVDSYISRNVPYLGAAVGRCANRIGGASFDIDGVTYNLAKNIGKNHLHGGIVGFDKVNWTTTVDGNKVIFSYLSKDGEEGYPGDLLTNITYELTDDSHFHVDFMSTTTKKTAVNLTNHSYFNLAGHDGGAEELFNHVAAVFADKITETDSDSIPTGRFTPVGGTPFDLRTPKRLGDIIAKNQMLFDNNFCVTTFDKQDLHYVSRVVHPPSGRYLEVYSDQPGVQLYTSYFLPAPTDPALIGKGGVGYRRHGAFCLETQNYPDAVHHDNFPSAILKPGSIYRHKVVYGFGAEHCDEPMVVPSVPDKNGHIADVALGYDDIESYEKINTPTLLGAPVGRVINRIRDARFELDGQTYHVSQNFGKHFLHGGFEGFNKKNWKSAVDGNKVIFSYLSKDGEEGFPGDLITSIIYEVTEDMKLHTEFIATTSKKTIVNLGNHAYFNLAGHDAGAEALYDHVVLVNSDKITDSDEDFVPTGDLIEVGGTPFDLRTPKRLGDLIVNAGPRFHHNFCISNYNKKDLNFVARVNHPPSGRYLEVYSNQPGLQFYTGYYLPYPPEPALLGKGGVGYRRHAGFCLETQNYPDAINHTNFPSPVLKPGDVYRHKVQYRFGVDKQET